MNNFRTVDDILDSVVAKLENSEEPSTAIDARDLAITFELTCMKQAMGRICEFKGVRPFSSVADKPLISLLRNRTRSHCVQILAREAHRVSEEEGNETE